MIDLITNLKTTQQRITTAEQRYGRPAGSVALLAVSKTHPISSLNALFTAGQIHFGENYLQEALQKMSALPQKSIVWHFIGAIQSKKIQDIAKNFSWVHTISRLSDAALLSRFRPLDLPPLQICIQVKLDDNPAKSGVPPEEVPALVHAIHALPHLTLRGLMALPPLCEDFEQQRYYFKIIKTLFDNLQTKIPSLDTLSMGMSQDLEAAIAEGATMVRIGTGIFGPREVTHATT